MEPIGSDPPGSFFLSHLIARLTPINTQSEYSPPMQTMKFGIFHK